MKKYSQKKFRITEACYLLWIILIIVLYFGTTSIDPFLEKGAVLHLLITLNLASFLLFGIDKLFAINHLPRISEKQLYASAFLGGPIGALFAIFLFRHKTRKQDFLLIITLLILVEIGLIYFLAQL